MAFIKKHWKLLVFILVIILGFVVALVLNSKISAILSLLSAMFVSLFHITKTTNNQDEIQQIETIIKTKKEDRNNLIRQYEEKKVDFNKEEKEINEKINNMSLSDKLRFLNDRS